MHRTFITADDKEQKIIVNLMQQKKIKETFYWLVIGEYGETKGWELNIDERSYTSNIRVM